MTNATLTLPKAVTHLDHDWRIETAEAVEASLTGAPYLALFWGSASRAVDATLWQFNQGELQAAVPHAQGFLVYDRECRVYLPTMAYRWACAQTRATPVDAAEPDATPVDAAEPDAAERAPNAVYCPECGNAEGIYARADIRWDSEAQEWTVCDMEEMLDCTECDATFTLSDLAGALSVPAEQAVDAITLTTIAALAEPDPDPLRDAAPDLLEALREMLADAETMNEPYRNEAICERARAAIAKAEGR